jgi:hypothetical protein
LAGFSNLAAGAFIVESSSNRRSAETRWRWRSRRRVNRLSARDQHADQHTCANANTRCGIRMVAHRVGSASHRTLCLKLCTCFEVGEFRLHEIHLTLEGVTSSVESLISVSLCDREQMFRRPSKIPQAVGYALAGKSFRSEEVIRAHGCDSFKAAAFE